MRWMNLEPIIHSEVRQKKKDEYCILTYIWNLEKSYWRICLQGNNGETDIENRLNGHGERGEEGEMHGKSNIKTYITICKIDS